MINMNVNDAQLTRLGLEYSTAKVIAQRINELPSSLSTDKFWQVISKEILTPEHPFELHLYLYSSIFADWDSTKGPPPAWIPTDKISSSTNIATAMKELDINSYDELFQWSIQNRESFWDFMIKKLNIHFNISPSDILDHSSPGESLRWLTDVKFNIVDSCFQATEDSIVIIAQPGLH